MPEASDDAVCTSPVSLENHKLNIKKSENGDIPHEFGHGDLVCRLQIVQCLLHPSWYQIIKPNHIFLGNSSIDPLRRAMTFISPTLPKANKPNVQWHFQAMGPGC